MALHWNVEDVENYESVCYRRANSHDAKHHPVEVGDRILRVQTERLIWNMLGAGFRSITKDNWTKVYARIAIVEALHSVPRDERTSPKTVKSHVGLRTNVSKETDAQWRKRQFEHAMRHAERYAKQQAVE